MRLLSCAAVCLFCAPLQSAEVELNGHRFTLADGFEISHVAGQPLVDRPVSADFDERGRLYVTDSSGSNENLKIQLEKLPHRIMRLEDSNGDGTFDQSTVFADKLMFPEGAMWLNGSLYVAAPPHIWKFTDADDDGVAEHREVWFDGKTVTHCGNDLHGPYAGPDGWIYWCKGAFAEQTYERPDRSALITKASHIFRRRPEGGPIESVMTGGMDNPVELVFTPGGERIFTTTFLVHPNQGLRDGLLHAVYGGVYGKDHRVLDGHPRTGDLMPIMTHMGVAAPCGLARLESAGLGADWQNNVLACSFNMHKVERHVLRPHGATFQTEDSTLVLSDNLDFHPTDVVEDADGSLIIVDTGGWFRLCCPTSQLEKPDVLGGIYRIRRSGAPVVKDPRGQQINWEQLSDAQLTALLDDDRFTVRRQARERLSKRGPAAVRSLHAAITSSTSARQRLHALWTLTAIDGHQARNAVRVALKDEDPTVRHAALHSVSIHRDAKALPQLRTFVSAGDAHLRRAAAEALGRTGSADDAAGLLQSVDTAVIEQDGQSAVTDRVLEHSLIYAAIELNDATTIRNLITSDNEKARRAALIALDQLEEGNHLTPADIAPLLVSDSPLLNDTAWWIVEQHADWGDAVVEAFRRELTQPSLDSVLLNRLSSRLQKFASSEAVRQIMADALSHADTDPAVRLAVLDAMAGSSLKELPAVWKKPLLQQLQHDHATVRSVLNVLSRVAGASSDAAFTEQLQRIAAEPDDEDGTVRLQAIRLLPPAKRNLSSDVFEFLCEQLSLEHTVASRSLAVDILTSTPLTTTQLQELAAHLPETGVMELKPLLAMFAKSKDEQVGTVLVAELLDTPAATSLLPDELTKLLAEFGPSVASAAEPLLAKIEQENRNKVERVDAVLQLLPQADIRRGLKVFHSSAASCIACHRRAYLGGHIGPDLSRIGTARSERDLLESILFPSLTFVRNFEPVSIVTIDGRVHNGVIRDETDEEVTVQLDAQKSVTIPVSEIEERHFGTTSIMPAGLEKQLSPQQLADLVKYLKEG